MANGKNNDNPVFMSPVGRVSFPHLVEPSDYSGKYEIVLVFSKDADLTQLRQAAQKVVLDKFGKGNVPAGLNNPFRKCSEKPNQYGEVFDPDDIFISFKSQKKRPAVVDRGKQPIADVASELYPGCWARVSTRPYYYDVKGNKGVAFGLNNVQKSHDDDAISGGFSHPDDDFDVMPGGPDDPNAYGDGGDDVFGGTTEDITQDDDSLFM